MTETDDRPERTARPHHDRPHNPTVLASMVDSVTPSTCSTMALGASNSYLPSTTSLDRVLARDPEDAGGNQASSTNPTIKLSNKRWFVLFAMSIFGFSLAMSFDTAPILSLILELLDLRVDRYVYIGQIFYYLMAVMAIPTAWFVDKYGIKRSIHLAAGLYVMNCSVRALLYSPSLPGWRDNRMYYYIISGLMGTLVNSIFFLLPLKVSETWFSATERSIAWTVIIAQLDLGVCIASFIYPRIMPTLEQIEIFAYINLGAMVLTAVVCLACVTSAAPEHPPSERMAKSNEEKGIPFTVSLKRMITNKEVVLHLLHLAIFESCTSAVSGVLQVILTSAGHSKIFAGNFMSINAFVLIIMLIVMASFVSKMSNITLACKLGFGVQAILFITYLITLVLRAPGWVLIVVSIVLTICKCWTIPNATNMTAHLACGLVSQATIIGFSITMTVIFMTVIQVTFVAMIQDVHLKTPDYTHSLTLLCIICAINELVYQLFFHGKSTKDTTGSGTNDRVVQNQGNENGAYNSLHDYE